LLFHGGFVAVASEDENVGIAGDGFRDGAARQRHFGVPIGNQVLVERAMLGCGDLASCACARKAGATTSAN
jgi:hypothetical protein